MFDLKPETMDARLRARPRLPESIGVLVSLSFIVYITIVQYQNPDVVNSIGFGTDFAILTNRYYSDFWGYNGPWLVPLLQLLEHMNFALGYLIWSLLNLVGVIFGVRVFNGRALPLLFSYQLASTVFYGQVTGLVIGFLALMWWALHHERWWLAGVALLYACNKYQLGVPAGAVLLIVAPVTWYRRFHVGLVALVGVLLSLLLYPDWGMRMLADFQRIQLNSGLSISLSPYIGLWVWLGWVPMLLLPLRPGERVIGVLSAWAVAAPYFQNADLILLFSLPVGWLGWLGNLAHLTWMTNLLVPIQVTVMIPIFVILLLTWRGIRRLPLFTTAPAPETA